MDSDFILMNLMCAKICHDLAAPVSAISMGLEMLADEAASPVRETPTQQLMACSIQATIARLEVFRCLTGFAGNQKKPTGKDIQKALDNYWVEGKIRLQWKIEGLDNIEGHSARLVLATLLTAAEGLPHGGTLTIYPNLSIGVHGSPARLREDVLNALTGAALLSEQTVRTIVPFLAATLTRQLGGKIKVETIGQDQFQIHFA